MGKVVGPPLKRGDKEWILKQGLFFHATAPSSTAHYVNVSPKCSREFRIIDDSTVAWLDLTGSGSETCAHLNENNRLTILFVALMGDPRIMRLHGNGRFILASDFNNPTHAHIIKEFQSYIASDIGKIGGTRAIVVLDITRVSQSCGYSIPKYNFVSNRTTLDDVTAAKGCDGMIEYRNLKNSYSINGLPSLAQLEHIATGTGAAPTAIEYKDGYLLATEYGTNWWKQLYVHAVVAWRFADFRVGARDVLFLSGGVFLGSTLAAYVMRSQSK
mmetsp:Transcript_61123/g.120368  ORF Transcript_61123/g.120368 Transcript_61123/m.120368 type:complete len:272 (+) Transcript_61123:92-907(+)|eukprot:CAMPEP_0170356598 /NCGR_PEP_ID=MMETSP0117_2-20130122/1261_1 /TAXON_ID=400756 /ORGANISM="Durinskia baltica, Strain CSIRO CS-38" /LENGTH=271 /DNA_ID=CAMNT_0010610713 /DNA_START=91 /DNA_END=906 /DNA_ORIENTATION=+